MVENGQQPAIRTVRYRVAEDSPFGVEVLTFGRLRALPAGKQPTTVHRADFHVLALANSGRGTATVDFVRHRLEPGQVVWIRPGWTHSWEDIREVTGTVVLFRPEFVPAGSPGADPLGPAVWRPEHADLVRLAAEHLRREYAAAVAGPGGAAILGHLLEVLLLRTADGAPRPADNREVFAAFSRAVETGYRRSREVAWYAHRLGYAPRTLRRATQEALGIGAKRFIDDRVVLEAKRLLAHDGLSVTACAHRLGFDDPANFAKFFQSRAGVSPGAFAEDQRWRR
ncbi:AraC-like DNA-binding protein [Amycolatopsis bartoniae]|uniref:Transcriptional regulator n=1 Tax=Amycolatopsis bartoniae TaxID=941986 RepID=A0A8H9J002_9PSEU|nr:AraC family transcriptional regulator [Amycolatopsis bartoniae]MBB2937193.1 AraC-like DNA-binding protein [Amycolatopsis bartoniae]GHF53144.1 transcriptional regulator [Amycolatopsis bartoniae]